MGKLCFRAFCHNDAILRLCLKKMLEINEMRKVTGMYKMLLAFYRGTVQYRTVASCKSSLATNLAGTPHVRKREKLFLKYQHFVIIIIMFFTET